MSLSEYYYKNINTLINFLCHVIQTTKNIWYFKYPNRRVIPQSRDKYFNKSEVTSKISQWKSLNELVVLIHQLDHYMRKIFTYPVVRTNRKIRLSNQLNANRIYLFWIIEISKRLIAVKNMCYFKAIDYLQFYWHSIPDFQSNQFNLFIDLAIEVKCSILLCFIVYAWPYDIKTSAVPQTRSNIL